MATKRITERFAFSRGGSVVRGGDHPVIEGVLICGPTSINGRAYPPAAFAGDRVKRYEGRPVYVDHDNHRRAGAKLGWFENVRVRANGMPEGDLHLNPQHPLTESVLWAAEHRPDFYGMSHVAHCRTARGRDGVEVVEDVVEVESIDLVADPATTKGLTESKGGRAVKISLKTFAERAGPRLGPKTWAALARVCEDLGDVADVAAVEEPPADADPGDLKAALMSALTPLLDEAFESGDSGKVVSALKDFIKLHAKHTGGAVTDDTTDDKPAEESKKGGLSVSAITETMDLLGRLKVESFSAADVTDLACVPAERRESLARRMFRTVSEQGEKPQSAGRHQTAHYREEREAATKVAEDRNGRAEKPADDLYTWKD